MTEKTILPIWTLGDPHNASRHKNVTTNSSFMVVFRLLTRRHISLRSAQKRLELCRCPILCPEMRVPPPLLLLLLLDWGRAPRRGLPRNTDEAREGTESSRQLNVKLRL
ncbi:hypothetical protein ABVT39_017774 [Epinephelus coioides]